MKRSLISAPSPISAEACAAIMAAVKLAELNPTQWQCLLLISGGTHRPSQIAKAMDFTEQAIVASLKKLVERDLLTRRREENDDRFVSYELTPAGRSTMERILLSPITSA